MVGWEDFGKEFDSETKGVIATAKDRLVKVKEHFGVNPFSQKDYMELFKSISSATASRDLKVGFTTKALKISGEKNQTRYHFYESKSYLEKPVQGCTLILTVYSKSMLTD